MQEHTAVIPALVAVLDALEVILPEDAYAHKVVEVVSRTVWIPNPLTRALEQVISAVQV